MADVMAIIQFVLLSKRYLPSHFFVCVYVFLFPSFSRVYFIIRPWGVEKQVKNKGLNLIALSLFRFLKIMV
jgi:hypothetical protein